MARVPRRLIGSVPNVQLSAVAPPAKFREVIVSVARTWLYAVAKGMVARRRFLVSYDTVLPVVRTVTGYLVLGLPGGEEGRSPTMRSAQCTSAPCRGRPSPNKRVGSSGFPISGAGRAASATTALAWRTCSMPATACTYPANVAHQRHAGIPVPLAKLKPGDLLFFAGPGGKGLAHHVAYYVGGGRAESIRRTQGHLSRLFR